MEKKQKIILSIIILALVLLCGGLTYAYFTSATSSESGSSIVAKGGTMNVVYDNKSANISVSNIYPRKEAWVTKKFQVIGNNTTDLLMFYKIKMVVDNNDFGLDLSYSLGSESNPSANGMLVFPTTNFSKAKIGEHELTLGSGYFEKGTDSVHNYTLYIYLEPKDADQNYAQEANFAAHLVIEIDGTSTEKVPNNWDNAGSNTLLDGIKKNYEEYDWAGASNPVIGGSYYAEKNMFLTPDDYGISYYYRGVVENNYVVFANMCWRIVRVTGDGSIKLTLYNTDSSDCTAVYGDLPYTLGSRAFAKINGSIATTKFNEYSDDNAYIGLMYGTPKSNTYAATHANTNKSSLLQTLELWYETNLLDYGDKLADVIWCNDKSTVTNEKSNNYSVADGKIIKTSEDFNGLGYNQNMTIYKSLKRGIGLDNVDANIYTYGSGPSLICPNDNNGGKLSKFTVEDTKNGNGDLDYKIGLLTIDEMIFAGYNNDQSQKTSYIRGNATSAHYWLLSPALYDESGAYILGIYGYSKSVLKNKKVNETAPFRPAIALKSDTTISGGDGTAANPFVIN